MEEENDKEGENGGKGKIARGRRRGGREKVKKEK